jgi:hypothetical protein
MKKISKNIKIAILPMLFLFLCSDISFADDKRFCGYIALGQGTPKQNVAAGYWTGTNSKKSCGDGLKKVKKGLEQSGAWNAYKWDKKSYYKCSSTKNWFEGINICNSCMNKKETGYSVGQVAGSKAIAACKKL